MTQALQTINQYQNAQDLWGEGGMGRAVLHAGVGGFATGDLGGALGAGGTSLAAPVIHDISNNLDGALKYTFDTGAGMAIGGLVGGQGGMMTGANTDWHNRQLHPEERDIIHSLAKELAERDAESLGLSEEEWVTRLMIVASAMNGEEDNQIINRELSRPAWQGSKDYFGGKYLYSIEIAAQELDAEIAKNKVLKWRDGTPIISHGEPVYAFQSTENQYRDHNLFDDPRSNTETKFVYIVGEEAVRNYLKYEQEHGFDGPTYGENTGKRREEIISFIQDNKTRGINFADKLDKDYYVYTGTGEVIPTYPEEYILMAGGLKGLATWGVRKAAIHGNFSISDKILSARRMSYAEQNGRFTLGNINR